MVGEGCDKPEESCLIFGSAADYYLRNGFAREISKNEAVEFLQKADEAGLVLQPGNSQHAANICCCCGCCCGVLRTLKNMPKPLEYISAAFYAQTDIDSCDGCEICSDRCQMDAITYDDGYADINLERCIGCGLCVTTCDTEAIRLVPKLEAEYQVPPANSAEQMMSLAKKRGLI